MLDTTVNGLASLSSTLLFLTIVTIALRFYARRKQNAPLQVDDWMVVAAWFFFAGITSISFYGISKRFMGYKQPNNAQYVAEIHPIMEKTYLSLDALSIMGLGLAKLSALFFYRRIFCSGHPRNAFSIITVLAIAAITAWTITFFVMTFLVCGPNINYLWAPGHSASAKCGLIYHYFMGTTISDFLLDVFILILPIPKIWSLNMNFQRKLAISAVFLLALVGLASSTARMALTIHLVTRGRAVNDEDGFQSNTSWAYFVILEVGLTIVAVNLPSLWYYVAGITPEGVLRSVRSIISLGSGRGSQGSTKGSASGRQGTGKAREDGRSLDTNSSRSNLTNPDKPVIEAYSLADLRPIPKAQPVNGIRVDRTFEHSEEHL